MEKRLSLRMPDGRLESVGVRELIIAGFTERDPSRHIAELRSLGVEPPLTLPVFFEMEPSWLTTEPEVSLPSASCSGEAEVVLIMRSSSLEHAVVTVGSDITDRELESTSIALAKQLAKPISADAWPYRDIARVWTSLVLRSWVGARRDLYQEGSLGEFLPPEVIVTRAQETLERSLEASALFLGTLPLRARGFRYEGDFRCELAKPDGAALICAYSARDVKARKSIR